MDSENDYEKYGMPDPFKKKKNSMGIASLVIGILSVVSFCCWYFSIVLGIAAIALGIVSIIQKEDTKGFAIGGIVLGAMGVILSIAICITIFYMAQTGMLQDLLQDLYNMYGIDMDVDHDMFRGMY